MDTLAMAPPVLSELLSAPFLPTEAESSLLEIELLEPGEGYWWRAGKLRASLIDRGYRPTLVDTLIAQTCIDHSAGLLTRDRDFHPFEKHAGLLLL